MGMVEWSAAGVGDADDVSYFKINKVSVISGYLPPSVFSMSFQQKIIKEFSYKRQEFGKITKVKQSKTIQNKRKEKQTVITKTTNCQLNFLM